MINIKLTIAYNGKNYCGWQRQKNAMSVQEKLEDAISSLLNQPVILAGSGRTDAGVHALGQCASFTAENVKIPLEKLPLVINALLPDDIVVKNAQQVPMDFHARFNATQKTYTYNINNAPTPNPLLADFTAFISHELDILKMVDCTKYFIGYHDFAAFCATGSTIKDTRRNIFECKVLNSEELTKIQLTGDGFLYNMVRIIAGTIAYVGMGKISAEDIPKIIDSKDRSKAGKTMPAKGLTLMEVCYSENGKSSKKL